MAQERVKALARDFIEYLKDTHGLPVERALLFGSQTKNPHQWSDIDVCIVSSTFRNEDPVSFLWKRRRKSDIEHMISPVGFAPEDYDATFPSPLVHSIKETGEAI